MPDLKKTCIDQLLNSSERRLARLLLVLANFGQEGEEPVTVTLSQEALADMIGTTRSRVSTFMNKFREKGFISYESHSGRIEVYTALLLSVLAVSLPSLSDGVAAVLCSVPFGGPKILLPLASLQITEIGRDSFDLCFGQIVRDRRHDRRVVRLGLILTPLLVPVRQFPDDVVMELSCQTRKRIGTLGFRSVTGSAWRNLGAGNCLLRRFSSPRPRAPLELLPAASD